jgi:hypothetical protein
MPIISEDQFGDNLIYHLLQSQCTLIYGEMSLRVFTLSLAHELGNSFATIAALE